MKIKMANIILALLVVILSNQVTNAQEMKKGKGVILSKKEVQKYIENGEAVYDAKQSAHDNAEVYRFSDGRILYKRDDGKGVLWKSLEQINSLMEKSEKEIAIFNFVNWIDLDSKLDSLEKAALNILQHRLGKKSLGYDLASLTGVSEIKLNDVVVEKELFYAMILYSCFYYAVNFGGKVEKEPQPSNPENYRPVVIGEKGRRYFPYSEYLKSYVESPHVSLKQSIDIERHKYMLSNE